MHTVQYDQYEYDLIQHDDGIRILQLQLFSLTPFMVPGPNGQPVQPRIPIGVVQIAMTPDTQRDLGRQLLAEPVEPEQAPPEPQPSGALARRCGRLQPHPSHAYPHEASTVWCDGAGLLAEPG